MSRSHHGRSGVGTVADRREQDRRDEVRSRRAPPIGDRVAQPCWTDSINAEARRWPQPLFANDRHHPRRGRVEMLSAPLARRSRTVTRCGILLLPPVRPTESDADGVILSRSKDSELPRRCRERPAAQRLGRWDQHQGAQRVHSARWGDHPAQEHGYAARRVGQGIQDLRIKSSYAECTLMVFNPADWSKARREKDSTGKPAFR